MGIQVDFQKEYKVDFTQLEVFEAGAMLLTILAYPHDTFPNKNHDEVFNSIVATAMRDYSILNQEWSLKRQSIKPVYFLGLGNGSEKIMRGFFKTIAERLRSARAGLFHLKSKIDPTEIDDLFAIHDQTNRNHNTTSFIEFMADWGEPIETHNFINRAWKPTKSVLHIALALLLEIIDWDKINHRNFAINDFIFDKAFIVRTINRSLSLANDIINSDIKICRDEMIFFNVREDARKW